MINLLKVPLQKLAQTDLNIYSLQLSLYKFILERNLEIKIKECWLVHLNENKDDYIRYEVPYLKKEIKAILDKR